MKRQNGWLWLARLTIAAVFATAAIPKIIDPVAFATLIEAYRVISGPAVNWTALGLPWLELVAAIGLLSPWLQQASAVTFAALLATFILLHAVSWARGLDISCGCFGQTGERSNFAFLILRNCALLSLVSYLLWQDRRQTPRLKES